jgi:hypothetical protein
MDGTDIPATLCVRLRRSSVLSWKVLPKLGMICTGWVERLIWTGWVEINEQNEQRTVETGINRAES